MSASGCGYPTSISGVPVSVSISGYGAVNWTGVSATGAGCYNTTFTLPTLTAGSYQVSVTIGNEPDTGTLTVGTAANTLTFVPNPASSGQTVTAFGCNFPSTTSTATVTIAISGYGQVGVTGVTAIGGNGCYSITFVLPTLAAGTYTVSIASGSVTNSGSLPVGTGTTGTLTVLPGSGPPSITGTTATTVQLSASGVPSTVTAVYLSDSNGHLIQLTPSITSNSGGTFSGSVTLPAQAAGGAGSMEILGNGFNTTAAFTITPVFTINGQAATYSAPVSVQAGQTVQVAGAGFKANITPINFYINGTALQTNPATVATDVYGNLSAQVTIPSTLTAGTYYINSQDSSGNEVVTAYITVLSGTPAGPIAVQGLLLQTAPNTALTNVTIGAFTDDAGLPASSYSVSISWGDGTGGGSIADRARRFTTGSVHRAGVTAQYTVTGSHTYTAAGVFPINVTIHAPDGRTAYLSSNAEVTSAGSAVTYQIQKGWNLLGPQLPAGATVQASTVAASILRASSAHLVALYGLTSSAWSPSYLDVRGSTPSTPDFTLRAGQGYLLYADQGATFTLSAAASPAVPGIVHTALTQAQRRRLPPLPALP